MDADTDVIMGTAKLSVAKLRLHKGKSCSRCYGNKIFSANILIDLRLWFLYVFSYLGLMCLRCLFAINMWRYNSTINSGVSESEKSICYSLVLMI